MIRSKVGYTAVALATLTALVHLFVGTPETAAPLLASDLPEVARGTGFLVWHFLSGLLFVLAATVAYGTWGQNRALLGLAALQSATMAAIGLILPLMVGIGYAVLPQGGLFAVLTGLILWALKPTT